MKPDQQKSQIRFKDKKKEKMMIIPHLVVLTAQNHQHQVTWIIRTKRSTLEETSDNVNQVEAIQNHT